MNDETLNNLLQHWATRHALSPERAEAIRAAALAAPEITSEALPVAWETYFRRSLTATLQQANRVYPATSSFLKTGNGFAAKPTPSPF